tara:strand:+ start:1852 stop:2232 length:381 start_codon:yes stop_codon:yes gene_type:complete
LVGCFLTGTTKHLDDLYNGGQSNLALIFLENPMTKKKLVEERNEAVAVVKKAAPKKAAAPSAKKDHVLFVSSKEETVSFALTVMGNEIKPMWDSEREHLIWRVPSALADRFAMHEFIVEGRIVREV